MTIEIGKTSDIRKWINKIEKQTTEIEKLNLKKDFDKIIKISNELEEKINFVGDLDVSWNDLEDYIALREKVALILRKFGVSAFVDLDNIALATDFFETARIIWNSKVIENQISEDYWKISTYLKDHTEEWWDSHICWFCQERQSNKDCFKRVSLKRFRNFYFLVIAKLTTYDKAYIYIPCCEKCKNKFAKYETLSYVLGWIIGIAITIILQLIFNKWHIDAWISIWWSLGWWIILSPLIKMILELNLNIPEDYPEFKNAQKEWWE